MSRFLIHFDHTFVIKFIYIQSYYGKEVPLDNHNDLVVFLRTQLRMCKNHTKLSWEEEVNVGSSDPPARNFSLSANNSSPASHI